MSKARSCVRVPIGVVRMILVLLLLSAHPSGIGTVSPIDELPPTGEGQRARHPGVRGPDPLPAPARPASGVSDGSPSRSGTFPRHVRLRLL